MGGGGWAVSWATRRLRREAPRGGAGAQRAKWRVFSVPLGGTNSALEVTTEAGRWGRGEPANPPRAARGVRARSPGPDARAVARSRGRAVARVRRPRAAPKRSIARRVLSPLWCTATYPGSTRTSADGLSASAPARLATLPGSTPRALEAVRADERLASPRRSSRRASSNSAARGRSRRRNRERSASACFSSRAFPTAGAFGGRDFAVTSERRSPSSLSARRMIETASARSEHPFISSRERGTPRSNEGRIPPIESHQSTFGFEYYSAVRLLHYDENEYVHSRSLIRRLSDAPDVFLRSPRSPRSSARAPRRRVPPARPPPGKPSRSPLEAASLAGPRRTSPRLTNDRKRVRPRTHHPRAPTTPRRDDGDRMPLPSSPLRASLPARTPPHSKTRRRRGRRGARTGSKVDLAVERRGADVLGEAGERDRDPVGVSIGRTCTSRDAVHAAYASVPAVRTAAAPRRKAPLEASLMRPLPLVASLSLFPGDAMRNSSGLVGPRLTSPPPTVSCSSSRFSWPRPSRASAEEWAGTLVAVASCNRFAAAFCAARASRSSSFFAKDAARFASYL